MKISHLYGHRLACLAALLLISVPASAHTLASDHNLGKTTAWDTTGHTQEAEIPDVDGQGENTFRFEVVRRGPVRVWTSGNFAPSIAVFDGISNLTGWDDGVRYIWLDAGTHYVRARSSRAGAYRLHITGGGKGHDDIGNARPEAAPIPPCANLASANTACKKPRPDALQWDGKGALNPVVARIDYHRDRDWFTFDVPDGPPIRMRMWSSGGTDTYAFLYDKNDFRLETDDDDGTGYNFSIHRTLDPGTYFLGVYGSTHGTTGPYRLHLAGRDDHGNFFDTASRVEFPSVTAASLEYSTDRDVFWFRVTTPGTVQIRTTGTAGTYGWLYDSFEVELTSKWLSDSSINTTLEAGTYYIIVQRYSSYAIGPYNLRLSGDASGVLTVPLVPANANARRQQGFVRVINHSDQSATVGVTAVDDTGMRHALSSPLQLAEWQTLHFNSRDLELGNTAKGIAGVGSGMGNWYLEVAPSRPEVEVLSYIRTEDGFLTSMHTQPPSYGRTHRLATFNPGSNRNQASRLRLINLRCPQSDISGCEAANVTIYGVDDKGKRSPDVRLAIPPGAVREVTAAELEGLEQNAEGLEGSLGDGGGKWQLFVSSDLPIQVISMLESVSGHLTNLSAPASDQRFSAPARE